MIIVDTGFWVALFNKKDQYHQSAIRTLTKYAEEPLITTWCVLTESCHRLLQRSSNKYTGVEKQRKLINLFQENKDLFQLFELQEKHLSRVC